MEKIASFTEDAEIDIKNKRIKKRNHEVNEKVRILGVDGEGIRNLSPE